MKVVLFFPIVEEKTNTFLLATVKLTFSFCLVRFLCSFSKQKSIVHPALLYVS